LSITFGSESISNIDSCNFWLWNWVVIVSTWHAERLPRSSSCISLWHLSLRRTSTVLTVRGLLVLNLLLHSHRQLPVGPSGCLSISIEVVVVGGLSSCHTRSSLGRWGLSIVKRSFLIITIHYLLSQHSSVFLSLFCEFFLWIWLIIWSVQFALSSCNSRLCVSVILSVYLLSCLFQNPVILVVIVMPPLVHQVFENLSHVVVIWSFFKL